MKVYVSEGVRTWRRGVESAALALELVRVFADLKSVGAWEESRGCWFADIVSALRAAHPELDGMTPAGSYQAVERCLPFEHAGLVYRTVTVGSQGRMYDKTKGVVASPGMLESCAPVSKRQKSLARRVEEAVAEKVAEVEPFANLYAMREEARRYMDARLSALEARVAELEKAALM